MWGHYFLLAFVPCFVVFLLGFDALTVFLPNSSKNSQGLEESSFKGLGRGHKHSTLGLKAS